jgi:PAS domain S-box-containing protein
MTIELGSYAAFDLLLEGCQVVDSDFRYVYLNDAVLSQARKTRAELIGRTMSECFPGIEHTKLYEEIGRAMRERAFVRLLNEFAYGDGAVGYFELRIQPVREGVLVFSLDVTDLVSAKRALERTNEELELRVEERTAELRAALHDMGAFAQAASHDLRAPVRAVCGFAQALREDAGDRLDAVSMSHLERIERAGARMDELIVSLLGLATISRRAIARQSADLGEIASEVASELAAADPARQVHVEIERGLIARCDPSLMNIALTNLLSNAWKFTSRREQASISFFAEIQDGARVYRVKDDGAGFDPSQSWRLFEVFTRLHEDAEFPGTGIGLATVASIVTRHGGRIWADGSVGAGATFSFTLGD